MKDIKCVRGGELIQNCEYPFQRPTDPNCSARLTSIDLRRLIRLQSRWKAFIHRKLRRAKQQLCNRSKVSNDLPGREQVIADRSNVKQDVFYSSSAQKKLTENVWFQYRVHADDNLQGHQAALIARREVISSWEWSLQKNAK